MDPLSITASLVSLYQLCNVVSSYILGLKNGKKEQLRLQQELQSVKVVLEQVEQARERAPDASTSVVARLTESGGPLAQLDTLVASLLRKVAPENQNVFSRLSWPFSHKEISDVRDVIQRLKTIFIWAQVNDISALDEAMISDLADIKEDLRALESRLGSVELSLQRLYNQVEDIRQVQQSDSDTKVIDWICPEDFSTNQVALERDKATECCEYNGSAIIKHVDFEAWTSNVQDEETNFLHVYGAPGVGKSVFMASVVMQLKQLHASDPGVGVASAYCSFEHPHQSTLTLLSHILQQIVRSSVGVSKELMNVYESHLRNGTRFHLNDVLGLLNHCASQLDQMFVLVDALDESDTPTASAVVSNLLRIRPHVKLLTTSRCQSAFPTPSNVYLRQLELRPSKDEISHYVKMRLEQEHFQCDAVGKRKDLCNLIVLGVTDRSDGIFLLAKLHLDAIAKKPREKDIRLVLESLPSDLTLMYASALSRIDSEYKELANHAFAWITHAAEPVTVYRLQYALALDDSNGMAVDEADFWPIDFIMKTCGGLLRLNADETISLVHYTLREFLMAHLSKTFPRAQDYLAQSCLSCVTSFECSRTLESLTDQFGEEKLLHVLQVVALDESAQLKRSSNCGFVGYAVRSVAIHVRSSIEVKTAEMLAALFTDFGAFSNFRRLYAYLKSDLPSIHGDFSDCLIDGFEPVHLAVYLGLPDLASQLIQRGYDAQAFAYQRNNRITPLFLAAYLNDVDMVQRLLKADERPNIPSSVSLGAHGRQRWKFFYALTPVGIALLRKSRESLDILLSYGGNASDCTSVDLKNVHLQDLSRLDEILGADTSALATANSSLAPSICGKVDNKRSPLPLTPDTPFFERYMLKPCAAPEPVSRASTPIPPLSEMVCSIRSHSSLDTRNSLPLFVIDMTEAKPQSSRVPAEEPLIITLLKVLRDELVPLVVSVLQADAIDATASDTSRNTALHTLAKRPRVSAEGTATIATLLTARGVDPRATNSRRINALHVAAMYGNTRLALRLIEWGADVDMLDKRGYGPLHYAAREGHQEIEWAILRKL